MTEDALVLPHKLSAWTFRRQLTSNKSNIAEKDHKREEKPHDRAGGFGMQERPTTDLLGDAVSAQ